MKIANAHNQDEVGILLHELPRIGLPALAEAGEMAPELTGFLDVCEIRLWDAKEWTVDNYL